jgi:two-component system sensor histidine kinase/response regulator
MLQQGIIVREERLSSLRWAHLIAIGIVAVLAGAQAVFLLMVLGAHHNTVALVDQTRRQGLLSQQIAVLSTQLHDGNAPATANADLRTAVDGLTSSQRDLDASPLDTADVTPHVEEYAAAADRIIADPHDTLAYDEVRALAPALLRAFDEASQLRVQAAEAANTDQRLAVILLFAFFAPALALVWIVVLRPTWVRIDEMLRSMRDTEARFRSIFEQHNDAMTQFTRDRRYVRINHAHEELFGYDPKDLIGKTVEQVVANKDRTFVAEQFDRVLRGETVEYENTIVRREGERREVSCRLFPIKVNDEIVGVQSFVRDVTEFNVAQRELKQQAERTRALYLIAANAAESVDEQIVEALRTGMMLLGMDSAVLGRVDDDELVIEFAVEPRTLQVGMRMKLARMLMRHTIAAGGEVIAVDDVNLPPWNADASQQQLLGTRSLIGTSFNVGGQLYGTLALPSSEARTTPFTANDRDFVRLLGALVSSLIERKLHQQRLAEARDQALEAARLKAQFLATMSHEIRTPINAIIGMNELLTSTDLSREQSDYVAVVKSSADALLSLINNILDHAKMEAGKMELESIAFDPVIVVESAADLVAMQAQAKGLALVTHVSPLVPSLVCGDQNRLRQILINLISNAVKFTENGSVEVQCDRAPSTDDAVTLRFTVTDTGIGLSPRAQERLFAPFTQAEGGTTSRRYGGTGLGLSICKRLVETMGGEIDIESKEGAGSRFFFTARFAPTPPAAELPGRPQLPDIRVLITGSDLRTSDSIAGYLRTWGATCDVVPDMKLALGRVSTEPFDIVIVDFERRISEVAAGCRAFREASLLSTTHCICLIGFEERVDPNVCPRVLRKPLHRKDLFSMVRDELASQAFTVPAPLALEVSMSTNGHNIGTILVVDDNAVNRSLAVKQLTKLGLKSESVSSGEGAVDAVATGDYALVLMDCQMPDVDGYEATRRIRTLEKLGAKHVIIVAMTANALAGDRETCIEAGMDDYLAKPVTLETLRKALANWLPQYFTPSSETVPHPAL